MWVWGATAMVVVWSATGGAAPPTAEPDLPADATGRQIFEIGCAACHGLHGDGVGQELVAFDEPLPRFSDCSFSSREPDADWVAVVHDGGPARGFARMMPAFGGVLSEQQILSALQHARAFCPEPDWPRGNLNFPRALFTEKAFVEDEVVVTSRVATEGPGSVSSKLIYEQRFGARSQMEVIVPYAVMERRRDWAGGLGDVALGLKHAALVNQSSGTILAVASEIIFPTGDNQRGFGKGIFILEPFVSVGQALPSDSFLHAQVGLEVPLESDEGELESFWRLAIGQTYTTGRFGRGWTPMVEVLGARAVEDDATTHWDVVPQMQVTLSTRQHIMMAVGARLPVNDREDRSVEGVFYLLWDWFDGGIDEGW